MNIFYAFITLFLLALSARIACACLYCKGIKNEDADKVRKYGLFTSLFKTMYLLFLVCAVISFIVIRFL